MSVIDGETNRTALATATVTTHAKKWIIFKFISPVHDDNREAFYIYIYVYIKMFSSLSGVTK